MSGSGPVRELPSNHLRKGEWSEQKKSIVQVEQVHCKADLHLQLCQGLHVVEL